MLILITTGGRNMEETATWDGYIEMLKFPKPIRTSPQKKRIWVQVFKDHDFAERAERSSAKGVFATYYFDGISLVNTTHL